MKERGYLVAMDEPCSKSYHCEIHGETARKESS